ncbi:hypothetical protein LO763_17435 [Glycomyces sp. A-F 0318]|uniref:hypothetical protein n=1 Tax=Glycomyces amatae TaxID=2881355 RepID=UPI001E31E1DE|nr:hypothetical protein [Glycomyces amatae]MCD0445397.1 hypothetical protein [Glycomyces amatae]
MTEQATDERRRSKGRIKAAWVLVVLAPVCAELTFTAVALPETWIALPLLIPMYGAGVLLIREAVVRTGGGWPSLAVLGLAYELAEDGLGLQALTSPDMYDATDWNLRVLGFNATYWESQIGIHVVFSVLIPVLLMDLLFPGHRGRPYLRTGGLVTTAAVAALGVAGLRYGIAATQDPGYQAPLPALIGFTAAIAVLAVVALKVLPGRAGRPAPLRSSPVTVGAFAAAATLAYLGLLMPAGLRPGGPVFGDAVPLALPMTGSFAVAALVIWLLRRWTADPGWGDAHRLWLVGGAMVAHTAFMVPGHGAPGLATAAVTIAVEVLALLWLGRVLRRRERAGRSAAAH